MCGAFNLKIADGTIASARIAFGGMAGIPKRAVHVEQALTGKKWNIDTVNSTFDQWSLDYQPLTDLRASAEYRLSVARNLLVRYYHDLNGDYTSLQEVSA